MLSGKGYLFLNILQREYQEPIENEKFHKGGNKQIIVPKKKRKPGL